MTLTHVTLADWDALPEDDDHRRLECVEGVIVVAPPPQFRHQVATPRLWSILDRALPAGLRVAIESEILLSAAPLTLRVPDVVVLAGHVEPSVHRWDPSQVHLAVEVLSPSNRRTDLVAKRAEYAAAGIPEYWIVDLDVPSLTQLRLGDAGYDLVADHAGTATIETCGTTVTVDLDTLGT